MYTALLLGLLIFAAYLFFTGFRKRQKIKTYLGVTLALLTLFFFQFMDFWGDALWYENLGYGDRFWMIINSASGLAIAFALFGLIFVTALTFRIPKEHKLIRTLSKFLGIIIGGYWGASNWDVILQFWNGVATGLKDPILGKDIGFYLFSLPFYDELLILLTVLSIIALASSFIASFIRMSENNIRFYFPESGTINEKKFYFPLYLNSAVIIYVLACGKFLDRYHMMYSTTGVAAGPGWTDVNVLLPAYTVVIVLMMFIGAVLIIPFLRRKVQNFFNRKFNIARERSHIFVLVSSAVSIIIIWFLALTAIPEGFQWLMVRPNEITFERPYILNNIKFTREGFGLNKVEEKEYPMSGNLTQETVNTFPNIFSNIRLWDWKALDAVYRQFQSIRLYYEFSDVDVDRYKIDGKYKQVMVSGREIKIDNLPPQSRTFVNQRFQYTHGYGLTMSAVNEFTSQGLPHFLIKDIPPVCEYPSLNVTQPQIYFGESTNTPVVVNSKAKEFDYPSGEENVYTNYSGKGGVQLSNFWRKFLYGWKFDGTNFLFSDYPTSQSRIMFHRQISECVKLLAPFLHFEKDPYLVLADGKLYWMIDAYTTSKYFPYSQPFSSTENIQYKEGGATKVLTTQHSEFFDGVNYIRNSVKVSINAYDGSVNFYIMDKTDPIINVWSKIFPHLFKTKDEMPKNLLAHIRYPTDLLLTQGIVYEKYHMTDPTVFYNQEDLWIRATAKYYNEVQPVEPYYIMWQEPGSTEQQFVSMLPFTPKNRQVLIGWVAGMCDPENYGRFLAYQFPKDQMVLGPQQVETKIDQDSFLSGQLTLWDQHGSKVIRGNVLAIPVNNTLFYVEPIYLQAETAAYPELRLVVVMHGENMSYAKNFDDALNGLFTKTNSVIHEVAQTGKSESTLAFNLQNQVKTANDAFNNYLKYIGDKKFTDAAKELEILQRALQTLINQTEKDAQKKK
ncbi:MAG: UPF0182 family protein [Ignavibacteriales bacterium]|nr:UPF0182 family protein [Ignavibacteriales bacterium]